VNEGAATAQANPPKERVTPTT